MGAWCAQIISFGGGGRGRRCTRVGIKKKKEKALGKNISFSSSSFFSVLFSKQQQRREETDRHIIKRDPCPPSEKGREEMKPNLDGRGRVRSKREKGVKRSVYRNG